MATKPNETNVLGLIRIDFNRKLIMPIEDAVKFMELISRAELMKGYSSNLTFEEFDSEITFELISVKELKEKKMAAVLDGDK